MDEEDLAFVGIIVLIILGMTLLIYATYQSDKKWVTYKAQHHCVEVARGEDHQILTFIPAGKGVMVPLMQTIPGPVTYQCDGNERITR